MDSSVFIPHPRSRKLLLIFLASFLVRALLAFPVIKNSTRPKFDEQSYFHRAVAFSSILGDLTRFRSPQAKDGDIFYAGGVRPPFQSIVLSFGMLLLGKSVAVARIMMIILSSMTTVLVFLVTDKLAGPKTGLIASSLHLGYPSFLAFSHYLWAETTYIFLLFLAVYLALLIPESPSARRRTWLSIFLGVSLGCLALTRSAALLPIFIIPAWIFLKSNATRAKIISPIMIMVVSLLTIFPWEYTLFRRENRFVLISNINYRNLYQGHNPWQKYEKDDVDDIPDYQIGKSLKDYMRDKSISVELAAKELAMKEITSHFGAFISGCIEKFLYLWTFDFFPLRHVVNAAYPPMSNSAVFLLILVFAVSAVSLYWLAFKGLLVKGARFKNKALILVLIMGGAMPYVITYGNSRYNLPQIALLLPIAAFGLANFKEKTKAFAPLSVLLVLGFGILFYRSYPDYIYQSLRPSSLYSGSIGFLDRAFNTRSLFVDEFIMGNTDPKYVDTLTLTIISDNGDDYSFDSREALKQLVIQMAPNREQIPFTIYGRHPKKPVKLQIFSKEQNRGVQMNPVGPAYWNHFKAIDLRGIELNWTGGR